MSQKLLKTKKTKIVSKKAAVAESCIVLVGTYREKQLAWIRKNGVYNYPVKGGDELTDEACGKVRELWLYADVKSTRHAFAAAFVGKMSREEFLAAYPTYAKRCVATTPSSVPCRQLRVCEAAVQVCSENIMNSWRACA